MWPISTVPLPANPSAPIYLSLPTRAGERSPSKPTGTAAAPTAQVQRLNNQKHVQYINISADSNLSMGKQGLHEGLRREDVTSDRAGGNMQAFSRSGGANGSRGSSSSSFVLRGVSYQPDGLISTEGLYHTSHLWAITRGQHTTSDCQTLRREWHWMKEKWWMNGSAQKAELMQQLILVFTTLIPQLIQHSKMFDYFCDINWLDSLYNHLDSTDLTSLDSLTLQKAYLQKKWAVNTTEHSFYSQVKFYFYLSKFYRLFRSLFGQGPHDWIFQDLGLPQLDVYSLLVTHMKAKIAIFGAHFQGHQINLGVRELLGICGFKYSKSPLDTTCCWRQWKPIFLMCD